MAKLLNNHHVFYKDFQEKYPIITRGEGVYIFDNEGKKYLDAVGGVGAVNIGHGVLEIIEVMTKQAKNLAFCYNVDNEPKIKLATKLQEWAPKGMGNTKTIFSSGGSEANEGALKIAYQYHCERGKPTKRKIISRWQSYHGNTIGTLSMGGRTLWRKLYGPYLLDFPHIHPPYCYRCPYQKSYSNCQIQCAYELERMIHQEGPDNVGAFIAEPVLGTSLSAYVPPNEYYPIIRKICDDNDMLFIVDEVLSGIGRTGKRFAIEHWKVTPDIITTAKGISSGYSPLAASILGENVWRVISEGSKKTTHSFTYSGNPLSCAVGLAVLEYIEKHDLIRQAKEKGELLLEKLNNKLNHLKHVGEIRGKGLFIGIEFVVDKDTKEPFPSHCNLTSKIIKEAFSQGLSLLGGVKGMINGGVLGDHIKIVPPFTINNDQIDFIVETLGLIIPKVTNNL